MRLPPHQVALLLLLALLSAHIARAQSSDAVATAPSQASPVPNAQHPEATTSTSRKKVRLRRKIVRNKISRNKISRTAASGDGSEKVVVRHGGTTEPLPQMAPVTPQHQDSSERRKSGQLLTTTEANLKSLGDRKLSPEQQATVAQIHQFMEQSRAALDAGDLTQGYNLASKANVLSEELTKK